MARSIESLLDLSTVSIEEAIGRLKVVDSNEPQAAHQSLLHPRVEELHHQLGTTR